MFRSTALHQHRRLALPRLKTTGKPSSEEISTAENETAIIEHEMPHELEGLPRVDEAIHALGQTVESGIILVEQAQKHPRELPVPAQQGPGDIAIPDQCLAGMSENALRPANIARPLPVAVIMPLGNSGYVMVHFCLLDVAGGKPPATYQLSPSYTTAIELSVSDTLQVFRARLGGDLMSVPSRREDYDRWVQDLCVRWNVGEIMAGDASTGITPPCLQEDFA